LLIRGAIVAGIVGVLFLVGLGVARWLDRVGPATWPLVEAIAWFAAMFVAIAVAYKLRPIRPIAAMAVVGFALAADLAVNNGPNGASGLPPEMVEMLEPDSKNETIAKLKALTASGKSETRRDRVELTGLGFNWPNASLTHGLENTLGYNPLRLSYYSAATGAEDHSGLPDQRKFSALMPGYRSKLADLLGLRWIVTGVPIEEIDRRLKPGEMPLIARTKDGYIYENTRALPRVMFARRAVAWDLDQLIQSGAWPDYDLTQTVLIDDPNPAITNLGNGSELLLPGQARIISVTNTATEIEVSSPQGGWVVLNDVWHPRWEVEIGGEYAGVALRVNGIFRAAKVPPGKVVVRFVFRPLSGSWRLPVRPRAAVDSPSADTRRVSN